MKKAISVLLCFVMVIGVFCSTPMTVFAVETEDPLYISHITGVEDYCAVSYCNKDYEGEIVIPATYDGLPVKEIRPGAFEGCANITSITIPESVEDIYSDFDDCLKLEEFIVDENNQMFASVDGALYNKDITQLIAFPANKTGEYIVPETVTLLTNGAFENSQITSITLNSKTEEINRETFYDCKNLVELNVSQENPYLSSVGDVVFNKDKTVLVFCLPSKTGEYVIPETVTEISSKAFTYSNLTSVTVGGNVKKIGGSFNSSNIYNITLEEGIEYIGGYAFAYCQNLTALKIPSGVKNLPGSLFVGCENINELEIGDNIGSIGSMLLGSDIGLEKLSIGQNIGEIDESAFRYIDYVKEFYVKDLEDWISVDLTNYEDNGNIFKIAENIYVDGKDIREITELALSKEHVFTKNPDVLKRCTSLKEFKIAENGQHVNYTVQDGVLYDLTGTTIIKYPTGKTGGYVFPDVVTTINSGAFEGAAGLTEIVIPERFSTLSKNMFKDCVNLEKVTLPESIVEIPVGAFFNTGFKELVIPDNVTTISENAFANCPKIETVKMSKNIEFLHQDAFKDSLIENYHISNQSVTPESVVGVNADNVYFDDGVKVIEAKAFKSNSYIKTLYMSDTIEEIGEKAFAYCENLNTVNFGTGLLSVGREAFNDDNSLEKVNLKNLHFWCNVRFSDEYSNPLCYAGNLYLNGVLVEELEIPKGVIAIENYTFVNCLSAKKIIIPSTVKKIGCGAFWGVDANELYIPGIEEWCNMIIENDNSLINTEGTTNVFVDGEKITELVIPETITKIPDNAFNSWGFLTSVVLPENLTEIGYRAFAGCSLLTEVTFPKSIKSVDESAFDGCDFLMKLYMPDVETFCNLESMPYATEFMQIYINGELPEVIEIPETVSTIRETAFANFTSLKKVVVHGDIDVIGSYAFSGCYNLEDFVIEGKISEIKNDAFENCTALNSVSVADVDNWCTIVFDGEGANPLCYAENLYCNGELVTEVIYPDDITDVSSYTFCGYDKLTKVVLPDSIKSIPASFLADCTRLQEVDFGNELEEIGDNAFSNTALTELKFPETLKSIAYSSFSKCDSLTGIYITDLSKWCNIAFGKLPGFDIYSNPLVSACNLYLNGELIEDLVIPEDVTEIKYATFMGSSIKTVTIHDNVTCIQSSAFSGCSELEAVYIGENVTGIMSDAFFNCTKLASVNIPDKVSCIGSNAFSHCSSLKSVVFPESLTDLGEEAFSQCTGLESVVVNDGLKSLPKSLFLGCTKLMSIKIPASVTKINSKAIPVRTTNNVTIYGVTDSVAHTFAKTNDCPFIDYTVVSTPAENIVIKEDRYVSSGIPTNDIGTFVSVPEGYIAKPVAELPENALIGTGMEIGVYDEYNTLIYSLVIVVMGDINGDGVCDALDCMLAELTRTSCMELKDEYLTAADYTEDSEVDLDDFQQIVNKALNREVA